MGDLTPPQQQQLTTFLQQLQALKTPRSVCCTQPQVVCELVFVRKCKYVSCCEAEEE